MDGVGHELGVDGLGAGERIGEGGSAVVYRARQEELARDVAVKVLRFSADEATKRRFDRERRVMGSLSQHDGIVTVYETGFTDGGEPYIVMPLFARSLADEIAANGPMDWQQGAAMMASVSRTVAHAHEQGIVHRDIKPANIMLSSTGRPLVADFGIARVVDSSTQMKSTALTLTPAYSPPEAMETAQALPASDVYSLAATLYDLIIGHPPFVEPDEDIGLMVLMRRIMDDPVPDMGSAAPPELQAVVERAMAKRPDDRYPSAVALADALEEAAGGAALRGVAASGLAPAGAAAGAGDRPVDDTTRSIRIPPPIAPPSEPSSFDDGGASESGGGRKVGVIVIGVLVVLAMVVGGVVLLASGDGEDDDAGEAVPAPVTDASTDAAEPVASDVSTETGVSSVTTEPAQMIVAGGEVILQPFDEPGDDPFTASVAAEPDVALLAFAATGPDASGEDNSGEDGSDEDGAADGSTTVQGVSGTADLVFAGQPGDESCNPETLLENLTPDLPETAAWAEAQRLTVDEVPEFVDGLTAAVLTADTRVTDHGYVAGEAIARQAVLQIGTAVLVDEFGEPQVRCASGSPLEPPEAVDGETRYVGGAWATFDPAATVAVARSDTPTEEFVLTDVAGGPEFVRPVGTWGATDRPLLPGEVKAVGELTSFAGFDPSYETNRIEMIFRPEGGPVEATFEYSFTIEGLPISGTGDLIGTYDPATGVAAGTGFGVGDVGGIGGSSGAGDWNAVIDPAAGTVVGSAGDATGRVTFELSFPPYAP